MINISYLNESHSVVVLTEKPSQIWNEVKRVCEENSIEVKVTSDTTLEIPWWSFLSCAKAINIVAKKNNISIHMDENIKKHLIVAREKKQNYELSKNATPASKEFIDQKLNELGFKRKLTNEQLRNVSKLYSLSGGATFSVPGAGKTTEALSLFFLKKSKQTRLLIIAPKNAFPAWEEQIKECLNTPPTISRLRGGEKNIRLLLRKDPQVALITYQQIPNVIDVIAQHYSKNEFFLFLDECHRIKRGHDGVIGKSILKISHLPAEKLIMSGTPMPNAPEDLVPQFNFLYPEIKVDKDSVLQEIQNIYVRTTKKELNLTDYSMKYIPIRMSAAQRKVYDLLKSETLRQLEDLDLPDKNKLRAMGKSVMKLLQATSNPALLLKSNENYSDELRDLILQGDSTKLDYVINRTRELVSRGEKVLIWSTFIDNIEILNTRLKDLGADFIHGGVDSGSEDDSDTREFKIKKFHDDESSMVLIANPAAASEGISLHTVCHHAIYLDRNYNAAQFLQSVDRIHRFGLSKDIATNIEIVICTQSIDDSVGRRLSHKIENMALVLNDPSLSVEPEYSDEEVVFGDFNNQDALDFLKHLKGDNQ
ncbi:hypothetical protein BACPU_23470 [Bacillus pumilus]|nr:hypothetical protein BACPU_23470 [Bacillus pumilus]